MEKPNILKDIIISTTDDQINSVNKMSKKIKKPEKSIFESKKVITK